MVTTDIVTKHNQEDCFSTKSYIILSLVFCCASALMVLVSINIDYWESFKHGIIYLIWIRSYKCICILSDSTWSQLELMNYKVR